MRKFFWVELPSLLRLHIVVVALLAMLVFGFLMTGRYHFELLPFVAIDWFVINLMNRATDLDEDLRNGVPGAELAARRRSLLTVGPLLLLGGSMIASHLWIPGITWPRVIVATIGLFYNYRWVPTPKGRTRFKEMYFFKNTMSAVIFVWTCVLYPWAATDGPKSWTLALILVAFFVPFELTYEIMYDFRDQEGDRAEGVPTYPVVHGEKASRAIVWGLLVGSLVVLAVGFLLSLIGVRELLMVAAPIVQGLAFRAMVARGITHRDCVRITHLGSALLLLYLVGTAVWMRAGLPENIYL